MAKPHPWQEIKMKINHEPGEVWVEKMHTTLPRIYSFFSLKAL